MTLQSAKHFLRNSSPHSKAVKLRFLLRSQKARTVGAETRTGKISEKIKQNRVKTTKNQRSPSKSHIKTMTVTPRLTRIRRQPDKGLKSFEPNRSPHQTKRAISRKPSTRWTYVYSSNERPRQRMTRLPDLPISESSSMLKELSIR